MKPRCRLGWARGLALAATAGCASAPPSSSSHAGRDSTVAAGVRARYLTDLDSLVAAVVRLDSTPAHEAFTDARRRYKRVEYLVEHFNPTSADGINGPALDDMEEDDPNRIVVPPEGFQVIETYLYPDVDTSSAARAALRTEIGILLANIRRVRISAAATPLTDAAVFDAARLELARIVALGITGFDSPLALRSMGEAADAVDAVRRTLEQYADTLRKSHPALADTLARRFDAAERALRAGADGEFDRFDRLAFIVDQANPLAGALLQAQRALGVPFPVAPRAWRPAVATPFEAGAFDPLFFAPAAPAAGTAEQVELGRKLFFEPALSRDATRSCASCHQPERGFADGLAHSVTGPLSRPGAVRRNAPTLLNAALQGATFADMRTSYLEDQVADVVRNPDEMHGSLEAATAAVAGRPGYTDAFRAAFGHDTGAGGDVTPARVRQALAAYLRSLESLGSRFDRYVRGERSALTAEERKGFNLFAGKGKCATCHFLPLFNGTVPPTYAKTEAEVLGVPAKADTPAASVDPDLGRYRVTRLPIHRHAFKTPTVRNVALTAPYMHNGVFRTLEEVVDFYDVGGGAGLGITLPNQTLPPERIGLTKREKAALVAFMKALTDNASHSLAAAAEIRATP